MNFTNLVHRNDIDGFKEYLNTRDVNEVFQGQSLLYWAVHYRNIEFTKHLVLKGADVNQLDRLGRTPLMIACYFGFVEIASFLLENGADMSGCLERAKNGWDEHVQIEIIELLKQWE